MEKTHGIQVNAPLMASYVNGNYNVELYEDGTKIRFADVDEFKPEFPENIDVCITKRCDGGCPYCYEGCTLVGNHGTILGEDNELPKWMLSLRPGTELALNGNDLTHPDLDRCLILLKEQGIVTNMTINQRHFVPNFIKLLDWQQKGLIHGLGISLTDSESDTLYRYLPYFKNVVIHVIAGIFTVEDLINLQSACPKILILGYKNIGRGTDYSLKFADKILDNINDLKANLSMMKGLFEVMSFDNLALEQLEVKKVLFNNNEEKWSTFYMGDDGGFTMYIDTVAGTYSKNSCMPQEERYNIENKSIDEMFLDIRQKYQSFS